VCAAVAPPTFDLQSHSVHSDGALAPAEVVAAAARAGVELLALSDHDTVDGVAEAQAAARQHGVRLVPAVELSSVDPLGEDLHILGYGIDPADAGLADRLNAYRADRQGRIGRMADALEELGWSVDRTRFSGLDAPGRPHLAAAAFHHPGNAERVAEEGFENPSDLLVAYLIPGAPAYRPRTIPAVSDAIAAIHDAGGVAVWAHPFWDVDAGEEVAAALRRFAAGGMDGVEAFYIEHGERQTHLLCDLAEQLDLLTTGSADFHGPDHPQFSRFRNFELYGREPRLGPIAGLRSTT
jgi:3',5'-nucleoside bisphosphate phosphatase